MIRPSVLEAKTMRIYSRKEAAELLRVSPQSLGNRVWRKKIGLQGIKIGKRLVFSEDSLMRFLAQNEEEVVPLVDRCKDAPTTGDKEAP